MFVVAKELGIDLKFLHKIECPDAYDMAEVDLRVLGKMNAGKRIQSTYGRLGRSNLLRRSDVDLVDKHNVAESNLLDGFGTLVEVHL
ncbi:hypothetical protein D9M70_552530 [compost metagenome]